MEALVVAEDDGDDEIITLQLLMRVDTFDGL